MPGVNPRFEFLFDERTEKPREKGLTMIEGDGPFEIAGMNYVTDLMEYTSDWIDLYKFQRGVFGLQSEDLLKKKLRVIDDNDIVTFPGGIPFEAAILDGQFDKYLLELENVGFSGIEISATASDISPERRFEAIERAAEAGFYVNAEVGKKSTEVDDAGVGVDVDDLQRYLDAGADLIIYEMEEIEDMLLAGRSPDAETVDKINGMVDAVGRENVMFEIPLTSYFETMRISGWFIEQFGTDVNLGNLQPSHVLPLEQQRRGLGQSTFQRGR